MPLQTLKRRAEFLRIRGGLRTTHPAFILEAKPRVDAGALDEPRFGFTVTKKIGNAVRRNRVRRRLKEAVRQIAPDTARSDYDYVIVARDAAAEIIFDDLRRALENAINRTSRRAANQKTRKTTASSDIKPPTRDELPLPRAAKNRQRGGQNNNRS